MSKDVLSLSLDENEGAADQLEIRDEVLVVRLFRVDDLPLQRTGLELVVEVLLERLLCVGLDRPAGVAPPSPVEVVQNDLGLGARRT